jgi:peptidoglycan/LPS O-acetylase OafA/YrhL
MGGIEVKASSLSFRAAVLFVIVGMTWGIVMAISENHSAMPAHAHLNLLGWVSLFLFGIYYRLHPSLELTRTALLQVGVWIVGTIVLVVGVGLIYSGHRGADPVAGIGSFILLFGMLLFGWIVYRGDRAAQVGSRIGVPAE